MQLAGLQPPVGLGRRVERQHLQRPGPQQPPGERVVQGGRGLRQLGDGGPGDREAAHGGVLHVQRPHRQHGPRPGPGQQHDAAPVGEQCDGRVQVVPAGGVDVQVDTVRGQLGQPSGRLPVVDDLVRAQRPYMVVVARRGGGDHPRPGPRGQRHQR